MKINFDAVPEMSVGFPQGNDFFGWTERLALGQLFNANCPTHAFMVINVTGMKFVLEECADGQRLYSLNEFSNRNDKIIYMCRWTGWNETNSEIVTAHALDVISSGGPQSKYDLAGLFSFIPIVNWFVKPDPQKQWCSENVASYHNDGKKITDGKDGGSPLFPKITLSPYELMKEMKSRSEFEEIKNYYV